MTLDTRHLRTTRSSHHLIKTSQCLSVHERGVSSHRNSHKGLRAMDTFWDEITLSKSILSACENKANNLRHQHVYMHIAALYSLVTVDTSTNYASIIKVIEYQHGWLKCLNFHCVSEARFFKRQKVHMTKKFVQTLIKCVQPEPRSFFFFYLYLQKILSNTVRS